MYEVLNKYLVQHKSISIPGLGSIVAETIPAVTDFSNKQFLPVHYKYRYDKYFDAPDREFFSYISQKNGQQDFESIKWYNEFAYELRNKIRTEGQAIWEGIGIFKRDGTGDTIFEPYQQPYELFAPVAAERIIRTDAKHSILVGDKEKTNYEMTELLSDDVHVEKESWWIYALVIAAIGLIVLFFHIYQHEMKWGVSGNQQKVESSKLIH